MGAKILVSVLVMVMAGSVSYAQAPVIEPAPGLMLLGGTVLSIDEAKLSVTLRMPEGDVRSFATQDRRLLQGLAQGDHVSFDLGEHDTIIKLVKLPTDPAN